MRWVGVPDNATVLVVPPVEDEENPNIVRGEE